MFIDHDVQKNKKIKNVVLVIIEIVEKCVLGNDIKNLICMKSNSLQ